MKRSCIIFLLLLMSIFSRSYSQPINMGFENTCGNPANAFFTNCFPDWTSACGSPDVLSNFAGITPFEGSKYAHMYSKWLGFWCSGNADAVKSRTEGIILNHNFKQGYTYRVEYAIQWKSGASNCVSHNVNWILTNGLANQTGSGQNCANDGGRTPDLPGGSVTVENFALPTGNSAGWQTRSFEFTPTANFSQLTLLNPIKPKPGSGCASNLDASGDIFVDGFSLKVVCDPNDVPWFTYTTSCNNGVVTVTATASDLDPQNHGWGLYQTDTPIADGGILIAGGTGTSITFTITDLTKFYYIKHGIWGTCYDWREKRELINLPQAEYEIFFPAQAPLSFSNWFCYGFPITMSSFGSPAASSYSISLLRRPILSAPNVPFVPYANSGTIAGPLPANVNLANLFSGLPTPVYFEPNYEYLVRVTIDPADPCYANTVVEGTVNVNCCQDFISPKFQLNPDPNPSQTSNTLWATGFNTYWNTIGVVHEWYVLSSPNPSGGPYTLVTSVTSTSQSPVMLYNNAKYGTQYKVIHRIKTLCGTYCFSASDCSNCRTAEAMDAIDAYSDCSLLDSLLCPIPTGLFGSCSRRILVWNPVQGAAGYTVEISYNDPACCRSAYAPVGMRYEVTGSSLPLWTIATPKYDCFRWRVMTKCANGSSSAWSQWMCYYCPPGAEDGSTGGQMLKGMVQSREVETKALLSPVVSPNPSNGDMTLSLQAPGDLIVSVDVVNAQGSRVTTIARNTYKGGQFNSKLSLGTVAKGVYTVVFNTNYGTFRKKVIVQ